MKGKLLTVDEILKLDDKYVYIEPSQNHICANDEGKAKVSINIDKNKINILPLQGTKESWFMHIHSYDEILIKSFNVYEWIEGPKIYYGDEILKMIREGKLKEDTKVIFQGDFGDYPKFEYKVRPFECGCLGLSQDGGIIKGNILSFGTFIIQEKEYMTFDEARKSGKRFKHKSMDVFSYRIWDVLKQFEGYSSNDINTMINEKYWEVEEC